MLEELMRYLRAHPKASAGAALGLVLGICLVTVGFFKTLVVAMMCALGYYVGRCADERRGLREILESRIPDRSDFR